MKIVKKLAIFSVFAFAGYASGMESGELTSILIEKYRPVEDRIEVEQILKDKWSSAVWGKQGETFDQNLANTLLNPVEPPPGEKTIEVARDTQEAKGNQIKGFITYISFEPIKSEHPDLKTRRGYIQLVLSKDMTPGLQREAIERKLRIQAIEKMKQKNPEKIEEFILKDDEFSRNLLKTLGFEQVKENQFARKFELQLKK